MIRAKVIGNLYATCKDRGLEGKKLLLVQPVSKDGRPKGRPLVAVDSTGSGYDEEVILVRGKEAAFPFLPQEVPTDLGAVGIIDCVTWNRDAE
ncbi:MAG: EutN/CcmL family microcompartment protein [Acidobacteria bacterium]|nr:EutN/CcmL family microcompartment protein [Acidobacteriota bacterium]